MEYAIGMIETYGDVAAIEALDAALKSSNVITPVITYIGGGIVTISFFGDVAAVKVAVDCGVAASQRVGMVLSSTVIARLSAEVFDTIFKDDFNKDNGGKEVDLSNSIDKKIDSNNDTVNTTKHNNDAVVNEVTDVSEDNDGSDLNDNVINMDGMLLDDNLIDESSDKKNPKKRKKKKK
ncbi:BMC domain-containing protein [Brachyspira pilosicoli]|uniref:BMC domain-containing protein n=1 Tax=Brachyspira pilosicoli TaxID=52584 RepID=UPI00300738D5